MPKVKVAPANRDQNRLNVRFRPDIKTGLEALKEKRYDDCGIDYSINRLIVEGVLMLLHHEGIVLRKPVVSAAANSNHPKAKTRVRV